MLLEAVHITNKFAQHGDTLITSVTNMPEQLDVRVTDFPESISLAKDVSALRDSVCQALSDSIHHLDSIVNHISTYGTDMPSEIKSFVIPFTIGLLAFAVPLIFNMRLKLQERYKINDISILLDDEFFYKSFVYVAMANALGLFVYGILYVHQIIPTQISWIRVISVIFIFLLYCLMLNSAWVINLIYSLFSSHVVYNKVFESFDARVLDATYDRQKSVEFCKWIRSSFTDCLDNADFETLQMLIQKLKSMNDKMLAENAMEYRNEPLVYAASYYNAIEDVTRYALQKNTGFDIQRLINSIPEKCLFAHHSTAITSEDTLLCYFSLFQIARENRCLSFVDDVYIALERDAQLFPIKLKKVDKVKRTNIIALKRFAYLNGALLLAEGNKTVTGYNTNIIQVKNKQHIFPLNKEEIFLYFAYALSHANDWSFRKGYGIRMKTNDFAGLANKLVRYTAFQLCEDELNQLNHPIDHYGTFDFNPYVGTELVKDISNDKELYSKICPAIIKPMIAIAPQIGLDPTNFPVPPQQLITDALNALVATGIIH